MNKNALIGTCVRGKIKKKKRQKKSFSSNKVLAHKASASVYMIFKQDNDPPIESVS